MASNKQGVKMGALGPKLVQCNLAKQDLKGQSVAVIGLGKSGGAAAKLALARGASVVAIDRNENWKNIHLEGQSNLKTVLGRFDTELLNDVDVVVVSPGVPPETYGLSSLFQSGKRVVSELDFAAEVLPRSTKILAVSGTNGKSTTVIFAGQMLSHLNIKTFVGGNLGNPLSEASLQCLTSSPTGPMFQVAVVEVSSYQLEIPNKYFCPSVAVGLNLTPDHLERHKTMKNYAEVKCRLFSQMRDNKIGILPLGNSHLTEAVAKHANDFNVAWIGTFPGIEGTGIHNYYNASIAAFSVIGLDIGIDATTITSTVEKLKAPPHRMEIVYKDTHGVTWINDSKATNVEATDTALIGLSEQKSVVLLGGVAKVLDMQGSNGFELLVEPLRCHRGVITKTLSANGIQIPCISASNLKEAVNLARDMQNVGMRSY